MLWRRGIFYFEFLHHISLKTNDWWKKVRQLRNRYALLENVPFATVNETVLYQGMTDQNSQMQSMLQPSTLKRRRRTRCRSLEHKIRSCQTQYGEVETTAFKTCAWSRRTVWMDLSSTEARPQKVDEESSRTRSQKLFKPNFDEHAANMGTGSLVNCCADRTSSSGENPMCAKSAGPEKANNQGSTKGP